MTQQTARLAALSVLASAVLVPGGGAAAGGRDQQLTIRWEKNFLYVRGPKVPGGEIEINYLEAYCRPGSTDRDWRETVIGHTTEKVSTPDNGSVIKLKDTL